MLPCLLDIWCTTLRLVCVLRKLIKITTDQFWICGTDSVCWSYSDIGTANLWNIENICQHYPHDVKISVYQFKGFARMCVCVCVHMHAYAVGKFM